jgi:MFS transporter, DHA1 family, multidrug resistance protein
MIALAALLFGLGMPESYQREIPRRRNKRRGLPAPDQPAALSGVTLVGFFTDPIFFMCTVYLAFNFGLVFQWFIIVPIVLTTTYGFSLGSDGLAFISAIVGVLLAAGISIAIEQVIYRRSLKTHAQGQTSIELRLIPAMYGGFLILASLFWIGWTATPDFHWAVPVCGTGVYVWGNASVLVSPFLPLFSPSPPC